MINELINSGTGERWIPANLLNDIRKESEIYVYDDISNIQGSVTPANIQEPVQLGVTEANILIPPKTLDDLSLFELYECYINYRTNDSHIDGGTLNKIEAILNKQDKELNKQDKKIWDEFMTQNKKMDYAKI